MESSLESEIKKESLKLGGKLKKRMSELGSQKGIVGIFEPWVKKNYEKHARGLSYQTIVRVRKYLLEELPREIKNKLEREKFYRFENEYKVEKAKLFLKISKEFLNQDESSKETKDDSLHQNPPNHYFYYLYFLAIGDEKKGYPKLGRAVLNFNDEERVVLTIPDENPYVSDYVGKLHWINKRVIFFDLKTVEKGLYNKEVIKKELHIKINFGQLSDNIILGSYNTYDKRVYTGSLVLEKINKEGLTELTLPKPIFISSKENREEFLKTDISIREYLSSKTRNIRKLPQKIICNKEGLKEFLDSNRYEEPSKRDIENRFLEEAKPIVFLASPQTSLDNDKNTEHLKFIAEIKKRLIKEFPSLNVHTEKTYHSVSEETNPLKTLKILEKTRFFILLLPKTNTLSFSTIQLGLALSYSKHILFIYDGDIVSERLKSLRYINNNFYTHNKDFSTEAGKQSIYSAILRFLNGNRFDKKEKA